MGAAFFVVSTAVLAFLYGFASGHLQLFPYRWIAPALERNVMRAFWSPGMHKLVPARFGEGGVRLRPSAEASAPGSTLVTSHWSDFDGHAGARLIDDEGTILHEWHTNPLEVFPENPHDDMWAGVNHREDGYIHGSYLFENGDLLFNIERVGLVRMDAGGNVLWRLERRTHHSVHRADGPDGPGTGNFWVCESVFLEDPIRTWQRLPGVMAPAVEDFALEVTPDGEVVQRVSVAQALADSPYAAAVFDTNPTEMASSDYLHLNDVEPLPAHLADGYPLFEAGDLLVSLRQPSLVLVLDPHSRAIKWAKTGCWINQHDPDWIGDGWISVYDNHTDWGSRGEFLGGSRIVKIRPHTGEFAHIYPTEHSSDEPDERFYSSHGGKAQRLAGGHWLITEPLGARIFEVDQDGREIWSWIKPPVPGRDVAFEVLEGTRYPLDADDVEAWGNE
jgi:hypothetical protein